MLTIQQLITIAPFAPDMQEKLIAALPTMSEDRKKDLVITCWDLIDQQCAMKVQFARENALAEMALGEKQYTKEDFQKMEDTVYAEFAGKLQIREDTGNLDEARKAMQLIIKEMRAARAAKKPTIKKTAN